MSVPENENTLADKAGSLSVYLNAFVGALGTASLGLSASDRNALAYTPDEAALAHKLGEAYIDAATADVYDANALIAARDAMIVQNAGYLNRTLPEFERLLGKETVAEKLFYYTDDGKPRGSAMEALREMNLPVLQAAFEAAEARGKTPAPAKAKPFSPKGPF